MLSGDRATCGVWGAVFLVLLGAPSSAPAQFPSTDAGAAAILAPTEAPTVAPVDELVEEAVEESLEATLEPTPEPTATATRQPTDVPVPATPEPTAAQAGVASEDDNPTDPSDDPPAAALPVQAPAFAAVETMAAVPAVRIGRIAIAGNRRVEEDAIRVHLRTRRGDVLSEEQVDADLRALFGMGFFHDVNVDLSQVAGEWVLTYEVVERPFIRELRIEGASVIDEEDVEADLKVRPNTIYDPVKVRRGIAEAKKLYAQKGYLDVQIDTVTEDLGDNEVVLVFQVEEKDIVRIQTIVLEGARAFSQGKLKRYMQTKEAWFLSFITGAGNLDKEVLATDIERLTSVYYDNGYIDVKIDEPTVTRKDDGLFVTIKIDEGPQFTLGEVSIGGDQLDDMTRANAVLSLQPGDVFRSSKLRADITALTEVYGDDGYGFVNVNPDTRIDPLSETVDVIYQVSKGPIVFIDKVLIGGNTKTRDKVVRRELELQEQRKFSGARLRRSQVRLQRTGFFEDVNITTRKSDQEDRLDLIVDVKEGSTGTFSAGAGISSGESFLFNVRLQEINLFGRGQRLVLNADFGSIRRNFSFDFTEPYFLDTEVLAGVRLFNWEFLFDDFTRGGTGATLRFLYPLTALGFERLVGFSLLDSRIGLEYRIERSEISDVDQFTSPIIRAEQGTSLTSSIKPRFLRDTSNHPFNPTTGSIQDFSVEIAGLGGDSRFIKAESKLRWYFPVYASEEWGTVVFSPGARIGYGVGYGDRRELPLFERYFPGGINSIRGFDILSLGPTNLVTLPDGSIDRRDRLGGSQQIISNNELIFPIVEQLGVRGVLFFDAGNAFSAAQGYDLDEIRMSTGGGIRWMSPIGPLRIELGFPLNEKTGDDEQRVMFSFGGGIR